MTASLQILQGTIGQMPDAFTLSLLGQLELTTKGLADHRSQVYAAQACLLARATTNGRDYQPAGVMVYRHDVDGGVTYIELSYVAPEMRGQRIYSALYAALRKLAIEKKCRTIYAGTHVKNQSMRAIAARMGRRETWVMFLDEIEPELVDVTLEGGEDV